MDMEPQMTIRGEAISLSHFGDCASGESPLGPRPSGPRARAVALRHLRWPAMTGKDFLGPFFSMETQTDHPILTLGTPAGVLLVNGNFEEVPFYWRVPTHWVAGGWYRWWSESTPTLPEFDDIRSWSPRPYDGNHAQVYFKWGQSYEAGIYQEVSGLTPCTPYRLTMWAGNDSNDWGMPCILPLFGMLVNYPTITQMYLPLTLRHFRP